MKRIILKTGIIIAILILAPLSGITITGLPLRQYLQFPPKTLYVKHTGFSWPVFLGYLILIILIVSGILLVYIRKKEKINDKRIHDSPLPWWGWAGIIFGVISWILAWTRFDWFSPFQRHTFTPLWLSYILTINAITFSRKGTCLMLRETGMFLLLFPISAGFWWSFEYLNRFVQNWYYLRADIGPLHYFISATVPFSTVLPAVLSTAELLGSTPIIKRLSSVSIKRAQGGRVFHITILILSIAGLTLIGVWPDILFPLLWISPLLIITSIQGIFHETHILLSFKEGRWDYIMAPALSALMCGFFWEMWNYLSYAKWKYTLPYVHAIQIFEMPLLGYAGYLPFGLECVAIVELFFGRERVEKIFT